MPNKADVDSSEEVVVTFDGIAILTPRGRYSVELHMSFLTVQQEKSISRPMFCISVEQWWARNWSLARDAR
ncbi:hypothetical protein GUJ93_ZPchr0006g41846 [Zizania palustris]|uniref:FACT complex subunit SSRP1 n=1 Tax=Zizania palustris TaxID=103762 RepID=A0A8J5T627_ZIZPA|nr:hypothetical protein GUJ93_ZPchr0006g41846 [Zizania palustris]